MTNSIVLLTIDDVLKIVSISRVTLYVWMRENGFPKPIKVSGQSVRWYQHEVMEWVASRPRGGSVVLREIQAA